MDQRQFAALELSDRVRPPPGQAGQGSLPSHGFVALDSTLPRIGITKQTIKKLEAIQMVRDQRENRKQAIAFHARPFVLCGLPLCKPAADQVIYTRRNVNFLLELTAHPRFGLPTVRADCTCSQFAFGMGRDLPSLPPAAWPAI
ncbi:MAG: hypothetical protein ABSF46_23805 [Terriglobia bacterium]